MERKNEAAVSWLDTAVGGIRFGPDRAAVREELEAHMEDKTADFHGYLPRGGGGTGPVRDGRSGGDREGAGQGP